MKPHGQFLTSLMVRDLNGTRNWELIEEFIYQTSTDRLVKVPKKALWNGASIPRFFWRVVGSPFIGKHRKPSVLHDWLWEQALQGHTSFHWANFVFWDALRTAGKDPIMAWIMWAAVTVNAGRIQTWRAMWQLTARKR